MSFDVLWRCELLEWQAVKLLASIVILSLARAALGAPPCELAPTIEPTGPLRLARYTKPFAQPEPDRTTRDYAARYTYGTPFYYWGCCGWYGYGGFYHPIYYSYGAYYPSY